MRDLRLDLLAAGGATTRTALRALGHSHRAMRAAVDAGVADAATRSWLVLPDAMPAIRTALAAGGAVGGASALATYGVWVTEVPPLQIATTPTTGVPAATVGTRLWVRFERDAQPWRVSIVDALAQHAVRVEREHAIASIDSALHQGLIDDGDLDRLFGMLPQRCGPWRRRLDAAAESGLESLLRVPCRDRGWTVESQVPAPGGGRSDLLIDGWLYVEADGAQWHDEPKQAAKDRRRNAAITAAGGRWLRFGYGDVVHQPVRTLDTIALVLAQGRPARRLAG
ncbi:DUF559 domain-containing protein [Agrococcus sp. SCSIO52902]|uniref:DUF559 domain-containing protein n=1 Tax=Agrococcus sp. SCSIO52902 TaxID=2933290 RepID=UPI001FF5DC95|nr:DUF559 domain-containing protein [Agrococcus sp. SCSIO52902]UOW01036.1 DUF559 domain-containing protein [Agrococcus sp. SCSIO52902]